MTTTGLRNNDRPAPTRRVAAIRGSTGPVTAGIVCGGLLVGGPVSMLVGVLHGDAVRALTIFPAAVLLSLAVARWQARRVGLRFTLIGRGIDRVDLARFLLGAALAVAAVLSLEWGAL